MRLLAAMASLAIASCAASPPPSPRRARVAPAPPSEAPALPDAGPAIVPAHVALLGQVDALEVVYEDRALLAGAGDHVALIDPRTGGVRGVLTDARWWAVHETRVLAGGRLWDWAADRSVVLGRGARHREGSRGSRWAAYVAGARGDHERVVLVDIVEATERTIAEAGEVRLLQLTAEDSRLLVGAQPESLLVSIPRGEILARFGGAIPTDVPPAHFAVVHDGELVLRRIEDGDVVWSQPLPPELAETHDPPRRVGDRLEVSRYPHTAHAWDVVTGRALGPTDALPRPRAQEADALPAGLEISDWCELLRRDGERVVRIAPPPVEDDDEEDEEPYEEPVCAIATSSDGAWIAFGRGEGVYLLDARTGALSVAPPSADRPGCMHPAAPGPPFTHSIRVERSGDSVVLGRCGDVAPARDESRLGTSRDGAYVVRAHAISTREDGSGDVVVEAGVRLMHRGEDDAERAVELGVRTTCVEIEGRGELAGWSRSLSCDARAAVSDDGHTVYLAEEGALRVIDVARRRARQISLDGAHVTSIDPLDDRFVVAGDALVDVSSREVRSGSRLSIAADRGRVAVLGEREIVVVDIETGAARAFEIEPHEQWYLSRDGTALVRASSSLPAATIDVATGARASLSVAGTFEPHRGSWSAGAQRLAGCDGVLAIASRDGTTQRFEDVPCDERSRPVFLADDRVLVLDRGEGHILVRVRDGATLELVPIGIHEGAMAVWSTDGRFFVPPALHPYARLREAGSILDVPLVPVERSPRYDATLLEAFLAE